VSICSNYFDHFVERQRLIETPTERSYSLIKGGFLVSWTRNY